MKPKPTAAPTPPPEIPPTLYETVAVIDCGSTGTRMYLYEMYEGDYRVAVPEDGHGGRVSIASVR